MEKKFRITVDGKQYSVTVEDLTEGPSLLYPTPGSMTIPSPQPAAPAAAPAPAAAKAAAGAGDVVSTLGGVVESIPVSVGQAVNQGDKVVIIEAMKMKTPMIAHMAGKITAIHVKAGDAVEAGQALVSIG
ncbi:MAG: biotin/lipoyl-binding protein [Burkholderiales bacterium]|nr:biotin/lipoyl-binding protein [Burkholderiales bacterium]